MRWGVDGDETHISTWIWVRWNLDRCEPWYGSWWEKNFWTWMEVMQYLDRGETRILGHGWRWDIIWVAVRCKYRELDWGETQTGGVWDVNLGGVDGFETLPGSERVYGWRRGNILWLWIQIGQGQDGSEMYIWNLCECEMVSLWIWDAIVGAWLEVRCHLDGGYMQLWGPGLGETRSGWRLVVNLGVWIELSVCVGGGGGWLGGGGWQWDTNASIPGWGYSWTLVDLRCNYRD